MARQKTLSASDAAFRLCNDTCLAVERRMVEVPFAKLPIEYRTVWLVWGAGGIIDNGGFEFLFECSVDEDPSFAKSAAAFDEIGCSAASKAFGKAFALFPRARVIKDHDRRVEYYRSVPEGKREPINSAFWKASRCGKGEITARLAKYIRKNKAVFADLKKQE
jgi:hypothetical protein